jgi:small-conductance mechanosensitive channel
VFVAQTLGPDFVARYQATARSVAVLLGTVAGLYLLGRVFVLPPVARVVRARNPDNPTIVGAVQLYLKVLFVVVAVPVGVGAAGYGGVAAGSGIVLAAATLALGVAGQDVIGNLVSGAFLVADPDFNVGDYIEWADESGTVEEIDLRVTRVRTGAGEVIVVPNTTLAADGIRRPFARDRYRVTERITVAYTDDLGAVRAALTEVAAADDRVLADPGPEAHVTTLGPTAVEVTAWLWVANPTDVDLATLRTEFRTAATDRLLESGVTVAPADPRELSGTVSVTDRRDG